MPDNYVPSSNLILDLYNGHKYGYKSFNEEITVVRLIHFFSCEKALWCTQLKAPVQI